MTPEQKQAVRNAAAELASDSAHIPLIEAIIEKHFTPLLDQAQRDTERVEKAYLHRLDQAQRDTERLDWVVENPVTFHSMWLMSRYLENEQAECRKLIDKLAGIKAQALDQAAPARGEGK